MLCGEASFELSGECRILILEHFAAFYLRKVACAPLVKFNIAEWIGKIQENLNYPNDAENNSAGWVKIFLILGVFF